MPERLGTVVAEGDPSRQRETLPGRGSSIWSPYEGAGGERKSHRPWKVVEGPGEDGDEVGEEMGPLMSQPMRVGTPILRAAEGRARV